MANGSTSAVGRQGVALAVILLACFLAADRFLVQAKARAYQQAEVAARAAEDKLFRARSEANRAAALRDAFGDVAPVEGGVAPIAIDFLNGVLAKRSLRKTDLRTDLGVQGIHSEPIQLTVQGSYQNMVLFIRDLESSRVPIWLRDVRISKDSEGTTLEMRVRLEIEGTTS